MSPMDWNRLAPHRPLPAGDALRVARPNNGAERLASLVKAKMGPIAVVGPMGSGKSTELAAAAEVLKASFVTALVPLDRMFDMREFDDGLMFHSIGNQFGETLQKISGSFGGQYITAPFFMAPMVGMNSASIRDSLLSLLREARRESEQQAITLLADGLEKCTVDAARQAIRSLLTLRDEAELVVVIPLELVTGPGGYEILEELRPFPIRPVPVFQDTRTNWRAGRAFLKEIFRRRMELSEWTAPMEQLVELAAVSSNGLPRTFLQLLRGAGGYAAIASREFPLEEDLLAAVQDQQESLQRILREGDLAAIKEAEGSDGLEIPIERRIRLLTHGLLLEYEENGKLVVRMNRLLKFSGSLLP